MLAGGSASRTIVASTKISANEAALLRATKGSVHAALRTALDALVSPSSRKPSETVVFTQPTITGTGCRVHKGYHEISRYYEQGIEYVEKECADCGARTTSRVRS